MSNLRIANRYASALLALTNEQKKSASIAEELLTVKNAIDDSRELQRVLSSPIIKKDKKKAIVKEIFQKKAGDLVLLYLNAIIDKGREAFLHEILQQYFSLRDVEMGIVRVDVKTSVDFSPKQEKELQKQLEVMTKKKVEAVFSIDKSLKGGFVARVGDTVLDGSVVRQLQLLKRKLKEGSLNN